MDKPEAGRTAPRHAGALRRELGLREAVAIGVGGTVGGGIFVLIGVAGGKAGPGALIAFAAAFVVSLVIALPYAELACRLPRAGGGYAFARQALGPHWGFTMGWIYWGAYVFLSGYVTIGFGGYLHAATGFPVAFGSGFLVVAIIVINLLGVKVAGKAQVIIIGAALAGLTGFALWGASHVRIERMTPFLPHGASGIFQAALVAFLSFGGFDMVAAAGEEVRKPEKNLPRAILITLFGVLALYLSVAFVTLGTIGDNKLGHSLSPLADAAGAFGGPVARHLILFCALLTTAATANAILVVTSRTVFAMARDRLLPARLATVHEATGIPWIAVLLNGLLILGMAVFGTVATSSASGGFLYVLHFLPPLIALVALRRDRSQPKPAFSTPWPWVLVPLAFACSLGLLIASGGTGATIGSTWLLIGIVGYATHLSRRRARARAAQPGAKGGQPGLMAASLARPADSATRRHDVHLEH